MTQQKKQGPAKAKHGDIIAIIFFFVLILTVWIWISLASGVKTAYIEQTNGVFNLLDLDFDTTVQKVDDITNWESWPEHLYTPEDFAVGIPDTGVVMDRDDFIKDQYATHRLTMLLPPGEIYGISMKTPVYSMRLFIGGEEIATEGMPATTREDVVPSTRQRTYFFKPEEERVEILIHTSNFVHGKSGCRPPAITVGHGSNVNNMDRRATFLNALIISSLLTAGLYHLSLFLLNRKRKTTLLFAACCILFALYDKRLIFVLFPNISWYAEIRLEYLSHFFTYVAVIWFFYKQFPGLLNKWVVRVTCVFVLLHCLLLPFDTRIFTGNQYPVMIFVGMMIVYLLIRFVMTMRRGDVSHIIGFVGFIVLGLCGINDIFDNANLFLLFGFTGQLATIPVGMVFFVFCYSMVVSIEYAETQRREEILAERNVMLDGLNRTKTEFLQDMSHEMKAPLTVIATGTDYADQQIRQKGGNSEEARGALDIIREETQRLGRMVSGMVDLASMDGFAENRTRVNFADLLKNSVEASRLMLEQRGNTLKVNISPGLPDVFAEHDRFTQVMINLFSNAADHTQNGRVTVTAEYDDAVITVRMSDTGEGAPPELLPHIFERGVSGQGGTGYGLYICKTVVEAHGGIITIESEDGQGTAVTFTVPVYNGQEAGHDA